MRSGYEEPIRSPGREAQSEECCRSLKVPAIRGERGCRPYTGAASVVLSLTGLAGLPGYTGGRGFSRGARETPPAKGRSLGSPSSCWSLPGPAPGAICGGRNALYIGQREGGIPSRFRESHHVADR